MAIHYVPTPLDGYAPGTLRHALAQARDGDVIQCLWPSQVPLVLMSPLVLRQNDITLAGELRVIGAGFGLHVTGDRVNIEHLRFTSVAGDAVMIDGPGASSCSVRGCLFVGGHPAEDEAVSVIRGAGAEGISLVDCSFQGYAKVILVGTGDFEHAQSEANAKLFMERCHLKGNGRRHPRIRYGQAHLKDCTIADWGAVWKDFCAGIQASSGARVDIENCKFKQRICRMLNPVRLARDLIAGGGPHRAVVADSMSKVTGDHAIEWRW